MKLKEIEKQILDTLKNFEEHDYKKNALKELDNIYENFHVPTCYNLEEIVNQYPDFNHLKINITFANSDLKDSVMITLCIKPELLDKKAVHKLAKSIYHLQR